ncbi:MAG: protease inhibitor I42 family protein, partial [Thermoflexales bacterium]|nr:protease inhibitor I42 family protein [Thermoflexales bacterium]
MFCRNIRCVVLFVALAALMAVSLRSARALDDGPTLVTLRDADNGVSATLQADQVLVIDIEQNASTGFMWEVTGIDASNLKQLETSFVPAPARLDGKPWVGAPGRQVLRFAALKAGTSMLTLAYRRSWEKDTPPERTYTAQVTGADPVSGAALVYAPAAPTMAQAGSLEPNASFIPEPGASEVLTPALNWCSTNNPLSRDVCSAVKNQGSCGSCWAFGTEGVVEAAIKKADGVERDTSEQYLVSCNVQGASCNGGWWAFGPSINQVPAGETNPGVRYESDFAYQASNAACNPPYAAHEVLVNSGSVALTVDAIKQAISDYGPVAAAICVGPAFSAYSSGIFATDEVTKCNGSVNHAIVLFGWDDTDGTWLLRNSWGPGWGQAGTMRIKWGTSKVGYGATYAVYNGPSANYNVAGFVRTPDGLGVAKATVSFTGSGARPSVTTNDSGYFIQT